MSELSDCYKQLLAQCKSIAETMETPPLVSDDDLDTPMHDTYHTNGEWCEETEKWKGINLKTEAKEFTYIFDDESETWRYPDGSEVDTFPMSAMDYISGALDVEYSISSDRSCLGGEVLVAFGGPNIWIDTRRDCVRGRWGSDKVDISYTDNIGIDEAVNELWEMGA